MFKYFLALALLSFGRSLSAQEEIIGPNTSFSSGFKTSLNYMYEGVYLQFTEKNNLYVAALAVPTLWYTIEEDSRISKLSMTKKVPGYMQVISDLSPALSFPVIPVLFYGYGQRFNDSRAMQFATETFATLYLTLIESAAISIVQIHRRPKSENLSKWETNLRGKSSFPSGHVIPYAVFAVKTYQFYGAAAAIVPSMLYVATSLQRMRDGKHYLSDVVGSLFLSIFASEGVRKAAQKNNDSAVSKKSLDWSNVSVGYAEHNGVIGPEISIEW